MRVLLNGLTALKPRTGIGQYCARLATELNRLLPTGGLVVYPPPPWDGLARRFLNKPNGPATGRPSWRHKFSGVTKSLGRRIAAVHFARTARRCGAAIYHEPNYIPFACDLPTVITIHDLSVILYPEWHPADRVREHARKLERAAADSAHIITDTEQVRREAIAELGVPPQKITAVHLGIGPEFQPVSPEEMNFWQARLALPANYFLCVGTIEPRKNLLTAMRAFADLPPAIRDACPLLLAGPWGWKANAEFEFFQRTSYLGIRHLGYVPDAALPALYSGAAATLYPSLYEGFGLPPLESVACGTPAICSRDTAAVREVMGDDATYCDAASESEWSNTMQSVLERGRPGRTSDSQPGRPRSIEKFSWRRTAELTAAIYEQVLNGAQSSRAAA